MPKQNVLDMLQSNMMQYSSPKQSLQSHLQSMPMLRIAAALLDAAR